MLKIHSSERLLQGSAIRNTVKEGLPQDETCPTNQSLPSARQRPQKKAMVGASRSEQLSMGTNSFHVGRRQDACMAGLRHVKHV